MTEKQLRSWERIRKRGEIDFILVRGVLMFGGFFAVLSLCQGVLLRHMPLNATLVSDTLVQSVAAGLFGGWIRANCFDRCPSSSAARTSRSEARECLVEREKVPCRTSAKWKLARLMATTCGHAGWTLLQIGRAHV